MFLCSRLYAGYWEYGSIKNPRSSVLRVIGQKGKQLPYDIFDATMDIWASQTNVRGSLEHLSVSAGLVYVQIFQKGDHRERRKEWFEEKVGWHVGKCSAPC